ncbi:MAG TPA: peptide deformylase [Candidatus Moranbacteria bacterium]|nr:peptide deformylase [Candidatus Moranbacteria bacterium]
MSLDIRKNGDEVLRKKAAPVKDPFDPKLHKLIDEMVDTMRAAKGVGLAAPQVGHSLRLCVIEEGGRLYILINPRITASSKTIETEEEGCLSIPGEYFPVSRHSEVQVRYLDKEGKSAKIKARGLLARALQHEIDHLDGILILDRRKKTRRNAA